LNYFSLSFFCIYLHTKGKLKPALNDRYGLYLVLALIDVEANFLVVKAYQYTTISSVMLLDCFTIPASMTFSYFFLGERYDLVRIGGVVVCVIGLILLVTADYFLSSRSEEKGSNVVIGDLLVIAGATLYAISNVTQEYSVKTYSRTEFLGLLGLFGSIISCIQMLLLEHSQLFHLIWTWKILACLFGFSCCLFGVYTLTPSMIKLSSAVVFNLSLLTSDFYGILVGAFLFDQNLSYLYLIAFCITITGLGIYHLPFTIPIPCCRSLSHHDERIDIIE
jgi:solute carrier family 35, member F1/2